MRYLFDDWNKIKKDLNNKFIALFLDYDGTISPIVNKPERALIPKETKQLLWKLLKSPRVKIAIVSGRALVDIKNRVGLENIIYVGNHGLEIEGPKIKFEPMVSSRYKMDLAQIKNDLNKKISCIKRAFVEDKGLALSLHYRLVDKKDAPLLKNIFHKTVKLYLMQNKIKVRQAKTALEVRPPIEWDKGKAVLWLLAREIFASKKRGVLPVYIGDDLTDEDAFEVLKNKGLTIFVGAPKHSHAQYYLKNPNEVEGLLERILEIL